MANSDATADAIRERLSGDPSEELIDHIASAVADEVSESFPDLTRKSRPLDEVMDEFRERKLDEVDSESGYSTKLDYIETYLTEEVAADTTENLTSEEVQRYAKWRKFESLQREEPLSDTTLQDDMYLYRQLIEYLVEHGMVPSRFENCIEIPHVDRRGGGVDDTKLVAERAKKILEYLRTYKYADVEHVVIELCCDAGPRKGGMYALDVEHVNYEEGLLEFEHSPETPLKNDEDSEREIRLHGQTPDILQDYDEDVRPAATDENGRNPLLTKGDGRLGKSTIQKIAYKWTRPCKIGQECPHDKDPEACEAAQQNNSAFKCPSSRAPHHIRTGYITDQRNRGVTPDAIAHRCDVTKRVQEKHYDLPDSDDERERYEDEFVEADEDPDSGFDHN